MNIPEILTQLKRLDGKFPHEALQAAIAHREEIVPELLQIVTHAHENPQYLLEHNDSYLGHLYAIYLLAQFREKSAYPLFMEFFSVQAEVVSDIADFVTDNLGRILASVYDGNDSLIKNLIENEAASECARFEGVAALVTLVAHGQKSREEVIAYLQYLLRGGVKIQQEDFFWEFFLIHTNNLYPEELYQDIEKAFVEHTTSTEFITLEKVKNRLARDKEQVLQQLPSKYPLVEEAIVEMENGLYFDFLTFENESWYEIRGIMSELRREKRETYIFPEPALERAIQLREQVTPKLLNILRYTEENAQGIYHRPHFMMHIYALYLLAQFREKKAYPLVIDFFSLPGEISFEIAGDEEIIEDLHRILACVYDGDDSLLKKLIENPKVNEFVRDAGLRTLVLLVVIGQKSREEVTAYFQSLFRGKLEQEASGTVVWSSLVVCCMNLHLEEVYEDIQQAYKEGLVNDLFVDFKEVEETYALGKETVLKDLQNDRYYQLIDNAIEEMQAWVSFEPSEQPIPPMKLIKEEPAPRYSEPRKGPKIGRNDPCPCGSGKKYKKCCLK